MRYSKRQQARLDAGFCIFVNCSGRHSVPGATSLYCSTHRQRVRNHDRLRRVGGRIKQSTKDKQKQSTVKRATVRRANGLCVMCGRPTITGAYRCPICKERRNLLRRQHRANRHKKRGSGTRYKRARLTSSAKRLLALGSLRPHKDRTNICAICKRKPEEPEKLVVDHCHRAGNIRGFICSFCNWGLGYFRDNPAALIAASKYILRWKQEVLPLDAPERYADLF